MVQSFGDYMILMLWLALGGVAYILPAINFVQF